MSLPFVPFEAGDALDWLALTEALAAGHTLPRAHVADTFLRRGDDTLLSRAAWIDGMGSIVKTATVFPGNRLRNLSAVNGSATLYSDDTGLPEALLDFHLLTRWKTAADSLLAATRLARPDSENILIVGAGTVSAALVDAYRAGFPEAKVRIWNRNPVRAAALAEKVGADLVTDLERAVPEADIVSCATMATEPLVLGRWLRPGQHIDLIGAFRPDMREADDLCLQRSRVFVDSLETTLQHIGELKIPLARGVIDRAHVLADYYELPSFTRAPADITLFKNGGGAHLDLMTARHILSVWQARGV